MSSHRTLSLLLFCCSIPGTMLCMSGSGRDARITEAFQARAARARERARQAQEQARAQQEVARILEEAQARERARQESIAREINARKAEDKKARDAEEKAAQEAHEREAEARAQFEAETKVAVDFLNKLLDERSVPAGHTMTPDLFNMLVHHLQTDPNVVRVLASDAISANNQLRVRLFNVLDIAQRLELVKIALTPGNGYSENFAVRLFDTIKKNDLRAIAQNRSLTKEFNNILSALTTIEDERLRGSIAGNILIIMQTLNTYLKNPEIAEIFAPLATEFLMRALQTVPLNRLTKEQATALEEFINTVFKKGQLEAKKLFIPFRDFLVFSGLLKHERAEKLSELLFDPNTRKNMAIEDWPLIIKPLLDIIQNSNVFDAQFIDLAKYLNAELQSRADKSAAQLEEFAERASKTLPLIMNHLTRNNADGVDRIYLHFVLSWDTAQNNLQKRMDALNSPVPQAPLKPSEIKKREAEIRKLQEEMEQLNKIRTKIFATIHEPAWLEELEPERENVLELFGLRKGGNFEYTMEDYKRALDIYYNLHKLYKTKEKQEMLAKNFADFLGKFRIKEVIEDVIRTSDDPEKVKLLLPYYYTFAGAIALPGGLRRLTPALVLAITDLLGSPEGIQMFRKLHHPRSVFMELIIAFDFIVRHPEAFKQLNAVQEQIRESIKGVLPDVIEELRRAQKQAAAAPPAEGPQAQGAQAFNQFVAQALKMGEALRELFTKEEKAQKNKAKSF